jgi:hypothetical protein
VPGGDKGFQRSGNASADPDPSDCQFAAGIGMQSRAPLRSACGLYETRREAHTPGADGQRTSQYNFDLLTATVQKIVELKETHS